MGLMDQLTAHGGGAIGALTEKFGIGADQAKGALDKIIPFVKGHLGKGLSLPGRGASLIGQIKGANLKALAADPAAIAGDDAARHGATLLDDLDEGEKEAHVQEVARETGLDPGVVRSLLPTAAAVTAGAMDADGHLEQVLDGQQDLLAKLQQIQADAKAGKFDE